MQYPNKHQTASRMVTTLVVASLVPALAMAGGSQTRKGHNPNGKPFVELAGAIVEVEGELSSLQDQIDSLVGRVTNVEEAQVAIEASIVELQTENTELQAQIDANAADVDSLENQISTLNTEILTLEQQIADFGDADGSLQAQIDAHDATITTLALSIDTLEGNLQASIDNNTTLIAMMQQQISSIEDSLNTYQQLVSGNCPAGQSVRQINADGSVVCEIDDVSGTATVTQYRVWGYATTVEGYAQVTAVCPAGSELTGGGFRGNFGSSASLGGWPKLAWSDPSTNDEPNRTFVAEVTGSQYDGPLIAGAICLQFN